ncbi:anthranilate synthase family protein [Mangrovihabitans endophyticus]|uniref:anthranilate synthase n=1 Tax=Mangrovihabitans endophyticus TaxID=1751298 RepID=A0A8J3FKP8_9ACTN|nr:anthranilate synthase family protein [Mangrovihabitans endophyticus]GGK74062.1 phenazine-specific anthranilate synthase component I [Mangrovihabitans endophyticus]
MTGADEKDDLLAGVLGPEPPAFALLHRPETTGPDAVEVLLGEVTAVRTLADIPVPEAGAGARHDVLALVPYRQITERGFACVDDGAPLLTMAVTAQDTAAVGDVLDRLPDLPTPMTGADFDQTDDDYAEVVRRVVAEEIGRGEGANFVVMRSFAAGITGFTVRHAMSLFRRLLRDESGVYWTFLVHTGDRTFVGATPERHVSVSGGTAVMNPISGTYRYPDAGPTLRGVLEFLDDDKETDELYMVLDEELKMMARICDGGGRVSGPYLKQMARLAHTEYLIEGKTTRDPRETLRETLFAPTVTGSPLENAARAISRHETRGRGYYSGVVALIGRDAAGAHVMDSAILIRTADIDADGRLRIGTGATLVRHSDPVAEAAETRAKVSGLLAALQAGEQGDLAGHPKVRAALGRRNERIAGFWLAGAAPGPAPWLRGRRVLIIDAEDAFTAMLAHQLRSLGLRVTLCRFDEAPGLDGYDLVVLGPGPGDPRDRAHPRIAAMDAVAARLLARRQPLLAVCLSHQILSLRLGLPLVRLDVPNQGVQREITLFGARELTGFYNTFAAHCDEGKIECAGVGMVEVSRDPRTGEVHALRGPGFASMQFHAESVLTPDGLRITADLLTELLG